MRLGGHLQRLEEHALFLCIEKIGLAPQLGRLQFRLPIDQKFVSGIGNIYASEILFLSKIKPTRQAMKLSKEDCKKIIFFSRSVLNKAIQKGGSSIRDFKNVSGKSGNFQKEFKVYQRENLNCLGNECAGKVKKISISNRSTFFCNICQK